VNPSPVLPPSSIAQLVPLASIPTDEACQVRAKIRPAVVRDYAQAMTEQLREGGLRFPAIVLFSDGQRYVLADGFHRVLAAREAGLSEFPAEVRPGSERDALFCSILANAEHGLPRSNADKRKAVSLLLNDAVWSKWSDSEIARHCRVSSRFVGKVRQGASLNDSRIGPRKARRGNTIYEMQLGTRSGHEPADDPSMKTTGATVPACDSIGLPLPADLVAAFAATNDFARAQALLAELAALLDQLAQGAGGAAFRRHLVSRAGGERVTFFLPELSFLSVTLAAAAPHCGRCPRCLAMHAGRIQPACKTCKGRGWLSKAEFDTCTHQERQDLERFRQGSISPAASPCGTEVMATPRT
jgi:hypothetical protein